MLCECWGISIQSDDAADVIFVRLSRTGMYDTRYRYDTVPYEVSTVRVSLYHTGTTGNLEKVLSLLMYRATTNWPCAAHEPRLLVSHIEIKRRLDCLSRLRLLMTHSNNRSQARLHYRRYN